MASEFPSSPAAASLEASRIIPLLRITVPTLVSLELSQPRQEPRRVGPFGPLFMSANVGIHDIPPVLANAILIHPLEVIRLEVCVRHQGGLQMARKRYKPEE